MLPQITASLNPSHLVVSNDSAAHAGHSAMRALPGGKGNGGEWVDSGLSKSFADLSFSPVAETHFSVLVVSEQFGTLVLHRRSPYRSIGEAFDENTHADILFFDLTSQRAVARHRLVNNALKAEFDNGLHALVISAKTAGEYSAGKGGAAI